MCCYGRIYRKLAWRRDTVRYVGCGGPGRSVGRVAVGAGCGGMQTHACLGLDSFMEVWMAVHGISMLMNSMANRSAQYVCVCGSLWYGSLWR